MSKPSMGVDDRFVDIEMANTILYCDRWEDTVAFYRDVLGLAVRTQTDWMVEFALLPNTCLSVADAARTSIRPAQGVGLTVTFKVEDLQWLWRRLMDRDIAVAPIRDCRMGGQAFFLRDPDGNRLEFWSNSL